MRVDSKNIQICNWKTYLKHKSPDKTQGKHQTYHYRGKWQCLKVRSLRNYLPRSLMSSLNLSEAGHCHWQDTGFKVRLPKAVQLPVKADLPFLHALSPVFLLSPVPQRWSHGGKWVTSATFCCSKPPRRGDQKGDTFQQQHSLRLTYLKLHVHRDPWSQCSDTDVSGTPLANISFSSSWSPFRWSLTHSSSAVRGCSYPPIQAGTGSVSASRCSSGLVCLTYW